MISALIKLRFIKMAHTIIWALFVGSILVTPILAWLEKWTLTGFLILLVLGECFVLLVNHMRCPLTDLAARYTDDRMDNFDIYLPLWLARYNKIIFGSLFGLGLLFSFVKWLN